MYVNLIIWGVVLAVMVIAELATAQLVSIWFAAGAAAAFVAALLGTELWVQLVVFAVVSLLLLTVTRTLLKKLKVNRPEPTNADIGIGKNAVVTEEINNMTGNGRAKLNGVLWKAVSEDDTVIPKDSIVIVRDIKGTKLVVSPCNEKIKI